MNKYDALVEAVDECVMLPTCWKYLLRKRIASSLRAHNLVITKTTSKTDHKKLTPQEGCYGTQKEISQEDNQSSTKETKEPPS